MKKSLKIIIVIVCLLAICIFGIAYAYLSDKATAHNRVSVGDSNITITETFSIPENVQPGTVIPKDVKVCNDGSMTCYVRVAVYLSDESVQSWCTLNYNTTNWVYHDGYYYYTKPVNVENKTTSLLTGITIKSDAVAGNFKNFDVIVYAESVQVGNNTTYQDAWQAFNVTVA